MEYFSSGADFDCETMSFENSVVHGYSNETKDRKPKHLTVTQKFCSICLGSTWGGYVQVWVTENYPGGEEKLQIIEILSSEGVYLQVSCITGSFKVSDPFLKFEPSCPFHLETIILVPFVFPFR